MPIGFCCENCHLYDELVTCLKSKPKVNEEIEQKSEVLGKITLKSTSIEGELLKVVIEQENEKKKTLYIDLKKYLTS
jgi:hypothetical protein